jgi:hypothetical protein
VETELREWLENTVWDGLDEKVRIEEWVMVIMV